MVGGREFQMQKDDLAKLVFYTLKLTTNDSVLREAYASRHETDILHVAALGLALKLRGDQFQAEICGEEVLRRFRGLSRFSTRYRSKAASDEFKFLVHAFAHLGAIGTNPQSLARLISEHDPVVWLPRVQMLIEEGNPDDLVEIASALSSGVAKNILSDACIRAFATAGVSITDPSGWNRW